MAKRIFVKNATAAFLANSVAILIGFFAQKIFVNLLGLEYLGLNSLFSNIISMLGVAELGIGSAIVYQMYKPIKKGNKQLVSSLVNFYKKSYCIIAMVIALLGALTLPFLHFFVKGQIPDINIYLVYALFIIDILVSYLFAHHRSVLYANQKNYIISIAHIGYLLGMNTLQIVALYLTRNYYLFIIIKILARIVESLVIHYIAVKNNPHLKSKSAPSLPKPIKQDILKKTRALFFHKVAGFVISGTDNIIISSFLGIIYTGLYANYYMILHAVDVVFTQAGLALIPSVGHMLVDNNNNAEKYCKFKKLRFYNFLVALSTSIVLYLATAPFIKLWLGAQYLLPDIVLLILVINHFQKTMRISYMVFKEAAGIYYEDRFVPVAESAINLIVSIILVQLIGLPGVFIGTIASSLVLWCFSYPKYVYKKLLGRGYARYMLETTGYLIIFAIAMIATMLIKKVIGV